MAVESATDRAAFFDVDEFGVAASVVINGAAAISVSGVFDAAHVVALEGVGGGVESTAPVFTCQASDVVGIGQDDGVSIAAIAYTVVGVQPTGDGAVVKLILDKV